MRAGRIARVRRTRLWVAVAATVVALAVVGDASAQPSGPPHRFSGSASIDGEPAAAGTSVTAVVNGTECGSATVIANAAGSTYSLDVPDSCAAAGDAVFFRVGGYDAAESGEWSASGRTDLDLTVSTTLSNDRTCPDGWEWNRQSNECAPQEPVEEPSEPEEPGEPVVANVEVTVWRSVSNPSLLYLSTRPEGGSWTTQNIALDMSALSRSGRFHQSNATAVAVSLAGGGTANVEVTVWRSVSNPSLLYLSTRPEGGSWDTQDAALDMSALSRSGRFHQSDAVVVEVPLPDAPAPEEPAEDRPPSNTTPADRSQCRIDEAMAARVIASTVKVETTTGSGSAFYIGNDEFITAAHVVDDNPRTITLHNERINVSARIVGYTSQDDGDIAILSASAPGMVALEWAGAIGEGAEVAVVGYPLGQGLRASISRGIVSRAFTDGAGISQIQTDAPANAGNSGGPLVDACGRVAGVVSWKIVRDSQGNATEGLAFVVGEPTLAARLAAIRSGQYVPPASIARSGPTWAQMDALVDRIGEHWGPTIDALNALVDQWNASDSSIPSNTLANIARQQRNLSQWMVNLLAGLRSNSAAGNSTLNSYLEAAISLWSANVTEYEELERYALDRATWGDVLWETADRNAAFAEHRRAQCMVWRLLYTNPEVVCDRVADAEQAATEAEAEARGWTPPAVTSPPTNTAGYSYSEVIAIVRNHFACVVASGYNEWAVSHNATFEDGIWRVRLDYNRRVGGGYNSVWATFSEPTGAIVAIEAPCGA